MCDSYEYRSSCSRGSSQRSAISSAEMPWGTSPPTEAYRSMTLGPKGIPSSLTTDEPMGVRVMHSTPAATTTS
jgi:hypothetical protein